MDFKDILKKYWFVGIVAIGLLAYVIVYCVQAYQNRTIYVSSKESDGKQVVYTLNDEDYYADDLYEDLYSSIGTSAAYYKWSQAVVNAAYETTDDITSVANTYYSYISAYNDSDTIDSSLKQSGYENGADDLLTYCIDIAKSNQLYKEYYLANFDTYVPTIKENYTPKKVYHILVKVASVNEETDEDGNTVKVAEPTEEETALLNSVEEALANGEDFKEVAKQYSEDSSAENGGYLGIYTSDNVSSTFVSEFADAVNNLGYGETSDVVTSEYGYHIIYIEEPSDDELKEDTSFMTSISGYYSYSNVKAIKEKSDELGFEIVDENLKTLIDEYVKNAQNEISTSEEVETETTESEESK